MYLLIYRNQNTSQQSWLCHARGAATRYVWERYVLWEGLPARLESVCCRVCSSVLQCAATIWYVWERYVQWEGLPARLESVCCRVVKCVAVCCNNLRAICMGRAFCTSKICVLQCVQVYCSVLQQFDMFESDMYNG